MYLKKSNKKKPEKKIFFGGILKVTNEMSLIQSKSRIRIRTNMSRIWNTGWTFVLMTKLMKRWHQYVSKSALKRPILLTFSLIPIPIPAPIPPPPPNLPHSTPKPHTHGIPDPYPPPCIGVL